MSLLFFSPLFILRLERCAQMPKHLMVEITSQCFSIGPLIERRSKYIYQNEANVLEPYECFETFSVNYVNKCCKNNV